jgi:hypothetical protein
MFRMIKKDNINDNRLRMSLFCFVLFMLQLSAFVQEEPQGCPRHFLGLKKTLKQVETAYTRNSSNSPLARILDLVLKHAFVACNFENERLGVAGYSFQVTAWLFLASN